MFYSPRECGTKVNTDYKPITDWSNFAHRAIDGFGRRGWSIAAEVVLRIGPAFLVSPTRSRAKRQAEAHGARQTELVIDVFQSKLYS